MVIWTILIPLSMGAAIQVLPSVSGRYPLSQNRARLAFWMISAGALFGLVLTMMSDIADVVLIEASIEGQNALSHTLRKAGSVIFYGTVLGSIFHSTNLFSGLYRGSKVSSTKSPSETTFTIDSFPLTSTTTIRKILATGAVLDTKIVPTFESNERGNPTSLHEEE